jgi:hypothetical protein
VQWRDDEDWLLLNAVQNFSFCLYTPDHIRRRVLHCAKSAGDRSDTAVVMVLLRCATGLTRLALPVHCSAAIFSICFFFSSWVLPCIRSLLRTFLISVMMFPDQVEALGAMLNGERLDEEGGAGSQANPARFGPAAPIERNNPNAGVDPLFKTVIKSGPSSAAAAASSSAPAPQPPRVDSRAIWTPEEVQAARELPDDDERDGRRKPDYDILYAQKLSAGDVFLNMSDRDASSRNCEGIVVKVQLPGAKMSEVTLDVTPTRLMVRSNQ